MGLDSDSWWPLLKAKGLSHIVCGCVRSCCHSAVVTCVRQSYPVAGVLSKGQIKNLCHNGNLDDALPSWSLRTTTFHSHLLFIFHSQQALVWHTEECLVVKISERTVFSRFNVAVELGSSTVSGGRRRLITSPVSIRPSFVCKPHPYFSLGIHSFFTVGPAVWTGLTSRSVPGVQASSCDLDGWLRHGCALIQVEVWEEVTLGDSGSDASSFPVFLWDGYYEWHTLLPHVT